MTSLVIAEHDNASIKPATLRVWMRGVTSTPRSAGWTTSSGFFLAFMMLGSVT